MTDLDFRLRYIERALKTTIESLIELLEYLMNKDPYCDVCEEIRVNLHNLLEEIRDLQERQSKDVLIQLEHIEKNQNWLIENVARILHKLDRGDEK